MTATRSAVESEASTIRPGLSLALAGAGHRAVLFHLGALWRLNDLGLLRAIDRLTTAGGGALPAARLAVEWSELDFDLAAVSLAFRPRVVDPLRSLAESPLVAGEDEDPLARALRLRLFADLSLADLPERPRLVLHLGAGPPWRATPPAELALADVVAAAARSTPVDLDRLEVFGRAGEGEAWIADRDGLHVAESPWPLRRSILVGSSEPASPDDDVRREMDRSGRRGAGWSLTEDLAPAGPPGLLPCPPGRVRELAALPDGFDPLPSIQQRRLVNWGYAASDAALRSRYDPELPPPEGFPYPEVSV